MNTEQEYGEMYDTFVWCPSGHIIVTNHLFNCPLYSWWVIEMQVYEHGEIEGTLLDNVTDNFHGPFITKDEAMTYAINTAKEIEDNYNGKVD